MALDLKPVKKEEAELKLKKVQDFDSNENTGTLSLKPVSKEDSTSLKLTKSTPTKEGSEIEDNDLDIKPFSQKDPNIKPFKIEEEEPAWQKMSKFGKVLDILGRPGYGMKNIIKDHGDKLKTIRDNPDLTSEEKVKQMQEMSFSFKEASTAFWEGLSGKERTTANKIWEDVGIKGVPFLGFATELALDPLQYGGYSLITKGVGKIAKTAGDVIKKIPGVVKTGEVVAQKTQPITSALKDMFITKTGIGKLGDLIDKHLLNRQYLKTKEINFGIKTRNVIQNISNKTGKNVDDVERQIVTLIEQPNVELANVPVESKVLANTIKNHLSNILTKEMKAGVPITSMAKNSRNIEYFPRITTKEAAQYLKQAKIGNSKVWNTKLSNSLKRKTGDFTLQEFNDFVEENGLKILGGRSVEQFFMQNPAYAVATRGVRSAKAVTSAEFLQDVGKTFGLRKAPSHWQELSDSVTKLNPSLKGLKFDPEVAGEITRVTKSYLNPQEAKIFIQMFDKVQNFWKRWTLAPFPKYHIRNMVGNAWNNYLAGVDPRNYGKAQAIQMYKKYKSNTGFKKDIAMKNLSLAGLTPQQADNIITNAEKTGVLGHGWYAADIETNIKGAMESGGIVNKGMAFGSTIENNARLAHFVDKLDKGDDAMTAAKSVKEFLFDYGDLTDFEKQVVKRLFPFYTWTRKNIPLQLKQLFKQPEKFTPLAVPLRDRDPQDLLRLKYAKPDLYEKLPIELRRDVDTITYIPLEGIIPAGDLSKMIRPQELLIEMLSPYIKTPIELAINKSFYREDEIQKYPYETQELLKLDLPVKTKYAITTILPQARLVNEINKIIAKRKNKQKLNAGEQAFAQSLSSVYKINLEDLRKRALQAIDRKKEELDRGRFWAKRNKREKEYKRIKLTYEQLKLQMKEIR